MADKGNFAAFRGILDIIWRYARCWSAQSHGGQCAHMVRWAKGWRAGLRFGKSPRNSDTHLALEWGSIHAQPGHEVLVAQILELETAEYDLGPRAKFGRLPFVQ